MELDNAVSKESVGVISTSELGIQTLFFISELETLVEDTCDEQISEHLDGFWEASMVSEYQATLCFIDLIDRLIELLIEDSQNIESILE